MKNLNDILKENGKYSQGRVYLFVSVLVYYVINIILMAVGVFKLEIDTDSLNVIIEAVKYPMTTFATYTLGGKVVSIFKKDE